MNPELTACSQAVQSGLAKWDAGVSQTSASGWDITLRNGAVQPLRALVTDEWLMLEAPLAAADDPGLAWRMLEWNAGLGDVAKFVLNPDGRKVFLRSEIPWCGGDGVSAPLDEALAGIRHGLALVHGETRGGLRPVLKESDVGEETAMRLERVAKETGWPFVVRGPGKVAFDLETSGTYQQALLETGSGGAVRLATELLLRDSLHEESREALGVLLLTACGAVRMARAAVDRSEELTAVRFEVCFPVLPDTDDLTRALAALSVACRLCAREAAALDDVRVARSYLAVRRFKTA